MMNKKLFNVLVFTAGAAIGSLVTWKVVKTKYERMIQEEVDAFKEDYIRCMRGDSAKDDSYDDEWEDDEDDEDDWDEESEMYHSLVNRYGNSGDDAENSEEGEGDEAPYINGPYVITPQDYGDGNFKHNLESLTYYADGVLANDWDVKVDIEETIGEEALEHFGDHAEDVVHVRNERLEVDYEVVKDPRTYAEVLALSAPTNTHEY